ncbi:MAG: glycoside hydrolase family 16 protein [Aeromicrobium sp.]
MRKRGWSLALLVVLASVPFIAFALTPPKSEPPATPNPKQTARSIPCHPGEVAMLGGAQWRCSFSDEFSGSSLDASKWVAQRTSATGVQTGKECVSDSSNNVAVSAGVLNLTVRKEINSFVCPSPLGNYSTRYTGGAVSTWERFSQAYGRFEIRARFPAATVPGLQSALWLYPQNLKYGPWPNSGEIDIAEAYSQYPDVVIPNLHYAHKAPDPTITNRHCSVSTPSEFHVYAAVWSPKSVTITYDGKTCLVHTWNPAEPLAKPAPFDQPFIVCLSQGLGIRGNSFNPFSTPLPATMQVDYVRVWSNSVS